MQGLVKLDEKDFAASGTFNYPWKNCPTEGPGGYAYVEEIVIVSDYSDIDNSSGGVTVKLLHNLINSISMPVPGLGYFGPVGINGSAMAAIAAFFTERENKWSGAEGDQAVATTETNEVRRIITRIPFWALGEERSDFSPLAASLARGGGQLQIGWSAAPANTTVVGNTKIYALMDYRRELVAVPPFKIQIESIPSLVNAPLFGGRKHMVMVENTGVWALGDVTSLTLKADGIAVLDNVQPETNAADLAVAGSACATKKIQQDFLGNTAAMCDSPLYSPIYPLSRQSKVSKVPVANQWLLYFNTVGGSTVATDLQAITMTGEELTVGEMMAQWASQGVYSASQINAMIKARGIGPGYQNPAAYPKTSSKVKGIRDGLWGYMPMKLAP